MDVRKNAFSMKYGFSKAKLQDYVGRAGILYSHFPNLGIPSDLRRNLDGPEAYRQLFEHYDTEILPKQTDCLDGLKALVGEYKRVALTCFEAHSQSCHRHRITQFLGSLSDFDTRIIHL